jgi:hypothetical protein
MVDMSRRTDPLTTVIGLVMAAGLVILLVTYKHELDLERADRARDVSALSKQVENLGGTPVVEPSQGAQGEQGIQGPGPTDEQVRTAVGLYFLANPPQSGRPPTDAEVTAAVVAFCGVNNCRGDRGFDGNDGINGTNGTNGADGPGPTDQQVADAVTVFCTANNNCVGPKGDKGDRGPAVESFTFTFLGVPYTCTDPEMDGSYACN